MRKCRAKDATQAGEVIAELYQEATDEKNVPSVRERELLKLSHSMQAHTGIRCRVE
jgi:hypothetical protein